MLVYLRLKLLLHNSLIYAERLPFGNRSGSVLFIVSLYISSPHQAFITLLWQTKFVFGTLVSAIALNPPSTSVKFL